jgi:hypothetical protein
LKLVSSLRALFSVGLIASSPSMLFNDLFATTNVIS